MLTRKDFYREAKEVVNGNTSVQMVSTLCEIFSRSNPRFDRQRFIHYIIDKLKEEHKFIVSKCNEEKRFFPDEVYQIDSKIDHLRSL